MKEFSLYGLYFRITLKKEECKILCHVMTTTKQLSLSLQQILLLISKYKGPLKKGPAVQKESYEKKINTCGTISCSHLAIYFRSSKNFFN